MESFSNVEYLQLFAKLEKEISNVNPQKIQGILKMLKTCIEFLEDPALVEPISFMTYSQRVQEFLGYCRGYSLQKREWSQILKDLDFSSVKSVCEICPGIASKALWGLATTSFQGEVFIWDIDKQSISNLDMLNEFLCLPFEVKVENSNFFTGKRDSFDVLLANHVLDDLFLSYLFNNNTSFSIYEENYFLTLIENSLIRLKKEPDLYEKFVNDFAEAILRNLRNKGCFIMLEYLPLFHRSHSLELWEKGVQKAGNLLSDKLVQVGFKKEKLYKSLLFTKI
jgi:hypothetical protein